MFQQHNWRKLLIISLSLMGVLAATLAGLSHRLEWLASLCTGFGDGCRETVDFQLLGMPVWLWGVIYYLLVSLLLFRAYAFSSGSLPPASEWSLASCGRCFP